MRSKIFDSYSNMNQLDEMTCIPFAFASQWWKNPVGKPTPRGRYSEIQYGKQKQIKQKCRRREPSCGRTGLLLWRLTASVVLATADDFFTRLLQQNGLVGLQLAPRDHHRVCQHV
jgi:hypothetical protein